MMYLHPVGDVRILNQRPGGTVREIARIGVRAAMPRSSRTSDIRQDMEEMLRERARRLGADGVVDLRFKRKLSLKGVKVSLSGTAVTIDLRD